jgi:hypothetical protein
MQHPLVTLITHPTNRLVPDRRGYDLDYDRLFELAVEHGRGRDRRRAVAPRSRRRAGAARDRRRRHGVDRQRLSPRRDARTADAIWVTTARRGWVEPRHVLNARRSTRSARSSPPSAARADREALALPPTRLPSAALAALVARAFALYRATMLPGFDFGDTGSFQTTVGSPLITPRDGYPLYFAIGQLFCGRPARSRRTR